MLRFKTYLHEIWNPAEHEDVDMSHSYNSFTSLSHFPSTTGLAMHTSKMADLRRQQLNYDPHHERHIELENEINRLTGEFNRRREESANSREGDSEKRLKTKVHRYSYPTFEDRERIKATAVNGMIPETKHNWEGQKMFDVNHVLENLHMFPGHHSGEISLRETIGEPTEVMISEHGRWNKDKDRLTTTASAMNTFKHVLSAIRHFKSLPVKEWSEGQRTIPGWQSYTHFDSSYVEPHRINDVPDGVHTFSGSTADPRKDHFYRLITGLLGDKFFNTVGKPAITSKQQRLFRRTGSYW